VSAFLSEAEAADARNSLARLRETLQGVLFGQESLIDRVIVGILARGHILLEGLPGLGKTALVKALGGAVALDVKRIQFTPDLLPGDVTGNPIFQELHGQRRFVFQPGPLFANLVLADEINRASPKTQSALLEAMQEQRVTVLGESHALPEPFFVLATQNPIELEGTYPLPEAQLDRFIFKLDIAGSGVSVLERIVKEREIGAQPEVARVMDRSELLRLMAVSRRVYVPDVVANYIARLVAATHSGGSHAAASVRYGASPRAAIALAAASRALALLSGRQNIGFEDVRELAQPVLGHRIILHHHARLDGKTTSAVVEQLLGEVPPQDRTLPATLSTAASA
jgi:MoxR-like ATPase